MVNIKTFYVIIFLLLNLGQVGLCQSTYNPQLKISTPTKDIAKDGFVKYVTKNAGLNDARFTLFGNGYFDLQSNFNHQFEKDKTGFLTKTYFNQRYKKKGPILRSVSTGGTGSGTVTNNKIRMSTGAKTRVGISWFPSPKIENYFLLIFENTSDAVDTGCVSFYYDDTEVSLNALGILDYGWAKFKLKSTVTSSALYTHSLKWEYENLQPGEQRVIYIPMTSLKSAGTKLNLGSRLKSGCTGNGNSEITNNSHTSRGHPHDPNIKMADKECMLPFLPEANTISYIIFFQNEGDAPAIDVFLKDQIDSIYLDINTLEFIGSEYSYSHSITGNLLEIEFLNINLPGLKQSSPEKYSYDDTESFIQFKICTKVNLPPGVIYNQAEIIFDTQPPIFTDYSEIPVDDECQFGIELCMSGLKTSQSEKAINLDITIVPNPIGNEFFIKGLEGREAAISIYNNQGKLVHFASKINEENNAIETSDLARGLYFIRIRNEFLNITKKVIKI